MTQLLNRSWAMDPLDIVWKNFFDTNSRFNTFQEKINYPVDIYETAKGLRFELAVVGLEKSDLDITVDGDTLRISHEKAEEEREPINYIQRGITRRSFDLAWKVAGKFNLTKLTAEMDKGLLLIDVPYADTKEPKKIKIN